MNEAGQTNQRLDHFVVSRLPERSRAYIIKLIDKGAVTVNGNQVTKAGYKVKPADKVVINDDHLAVKKISRIKLQVLYEDDDCVVINKPVGLLTHSKGAYNPEPTVATWLADNVPSLDGDRGGIVHRLDRATSGVMICAKTPEALSWLQKQFSQRKVKKTYIAVVAGRLKAVEALIDMPIERNPKKPQTFRSGVNGKPATTSYKVLNESDKYTLLELKPQTGRTHQLRVHLAHIGHPIIGDTLYNGQKADRLYLHAHQLELTLPKRHREVFTVDVPKDFYKIIKS